MTSLPDRLGQLFRLVLSSDKPGEIVAGAAMFNRTLAAAGFDLHWAADALTAALVAALEPLAEKDDGNEWLEVDSYSASYHKRPGSRPGLRVGYRVGTITYYDFWAIQHSGVASQIAGEKWMDLGGQTPPPQTVNEALDRFDELVADIEIAVHFDDQSGYWRVTGQRVRQEVRA